MASSKSSSQANQTTTQTDNRVAASDNAIALSGGATLIQDTVSDDIAIAAIETTGETARGINQDSLAFASGITDTAAGLIGRTIDEVAEARETQAALAENLSTLAVTNVAASKRDPESRLAENLAAQNTRTVQTALIAAAALGAVILLRPRK